MKVAIVGAGIAGPTLAHWLWRHGHEPTLIEKAPQLRTGGYVVDFWGGGYAVAERMGLTAELHATHKYRCAEIIGMRAALNYVAARGSREYGDVYW